MTPLLAQTQCRLPAAAVLAVIVIVSPLITTLESLPYSIVRTAPETLTDSTYLPEIVPEAETPAWVLLAGNAPLSM